jgi:nucleotide-binding universal stress UspA family protein
MYQRILVPVDGSSASLLGLTEALKVANGMNARMRILHVVDEFVADATLGPADYYEKWLEALREGAKAALHEAVELAKARGAQPESVLVDTFGRRAADVIIEQALQWPADLIVMGTHGRRGIRRLLMGSDAELVLRSAPVPVLMVREHAPATAHETKARP